MGFESVLKSMFPFISAAASLGGPLGGMAASAVGKAIGVDKIDPSIDGITKALSAIQKDDPEAMLKLKQVEFEFQAKMTELGIDSATRLEELANKDREGARFREMTIRDHTPKILSYIVVGLTAGAEGYFLFHGMSNIDPSWAVILGRILGTLDSALMLVLSYYFGSSSGSARKDMTIAAQVIAK